MRNTGLGLSALLIAAGAILAWAVTYDAEGVDLNKVGMILFLVGLGLGVMAILGSLVGRRTTVDSEREAIVNGSPVVERQRDVVMEHDAPR